jgi:hypothetical protein
MPLVFAIWSFMALGQTAAAGQPTAAQVKPTPSTRIRTDWRRRAYEALLQQQGGSAQVHSGWALRT